jgi:Ca-activated chloride channel homolog
MNVYTRALLVAGLLAIAGCDDQTSGEEDTNVQSSEVRSGPYVWPGVSPTGVVSYDEDLLADVVEINLDDSASMDGSSGCESEGDKFVSALDAIDKVADVFDPKSSRLGLFLLNEGEAVDIGKGTAPAIQDKVARLRSDWYQGNTPLRSGLLASYERVKEQGYRQNGYGRYRIIVLTDGESGDGDPAEVARDIVMTSPVEIVVIGFCVEDHALDIEGVTTYINVDSPQQLAEALKEAATAEAPAFKDAATFSNN